jgi:hypothetical protein
MVKKASLRSRTEKKEVWGGSWNRRVFGLGWIGLMAVLIFFFFWGLGSSKGDFVFFNREDGSLVRAINRD